MPWGGLVVNYVTEHLNLPLHCIDGGNIVARLSCVAVYATPKLEITLVKNAADALSSAVFMP